MTVGIHAQALFKNPVTGVEQYARQIIPRILNHVDARGHRFVLYAKPPVVSLPFSGVHVTLKTLNFPLAWTQLRLSWEMRIRPPDVLFVPGQALPRIVPAHTVVTIHGLEFEHVPQCYSFWQRNYLRFVTHDAVRRATHIIAVSGATKKDLQERYGVNPQKISVIHHGVIPLACSRTLLADPPFFIFVGRLTFQKNVDGLIRAFTIFKKQTGLPHRLVLVGTPGFGYQKMRDAFKTSFSRDDIVPTGYVPDSIRAQLLSGAAALVLPSWAEGFGMPILEAQVAGVPVICSNVTAMPEVAGEGALCVPPGNDEALADALGRIATEPELSLHLVAKGSKNVQRFSWDRSAQETLRVLVNNK